MYCKAVLICLFKFVEKSGLGFIWNVFGNKTIHYSYVRKIEIFLRLFLEIKSTFICKFFLVFHTFYGNYSNCEEVQLVKTVVGC